MQQRQQKDTTTTPTTGITNKPQIRTHTQTCMHKHMHNIHILLSESERRILLWNNPQRQICAIFTTGSARPLTLPHLPPVHPSFTASLSLSMCPCLFVWLGQLVSQAPSTHTHTHEYFGGASYQTPVNSNNGNNSNRSSGSSNNGNNNCKPHT